MLHNVAFHLDLHCLLSRDNSLLHFNVYNGSSQVKKEEFISTCSCFKIDPDKKGVQLTSCLNMKFLWKHESKIYNPLYVHVILDLFLMILVLSLFSQGFL